MKKYEYKREKYIALFESIDAFNIEGEQGWQIVNTERIAAPDQDNILWVTFMREKEQVASSIVNDINLKSSNSSSMEK